MSRCIDCKKLSECNPTKDDAKLVCKCPDFELVEKEKMQTFNSGATRTNDTDKLNYVDALCPLVLKRYVEYLGKHRLQADGELRDWDNWKQGIDRKRYMQGKGRHFWDTWLHYAGFGKEAVYADEEEALCAEMFNAMGDLHELLKKKYNVD